MAMAGRHNFCYLRNCSHSAYLLSSLSPFIIEPKRRVIENDNNKWTKPAWRPNQLFTSNKLGNLVTLHEQNDIPLYINLLLNTTE